MNPFSRAFRESARAKQQLFSKLELNTTWMLLSRLSAAPLEQNWHQNASFEQIFIYLSSNRRPRGFKRLLKCPFPLFLLQNSWPLDSASSRTPTKIACKRPTRKFGSWRRSWRRGESRWELARFHRNWEHFVELLKEKWRKRTLKRVPGLINIILLIIKVLCWIFWKNNLKKTPEPDIWTQGLPCAPKASTAAKDRWLRSCFSIFPHFNVQNLLVCMHYLL